MIHSQYGHCRPGFLYNVSKGIIKIPFWYVFMPTSSVVSDQAAKTPMLSQYDLKFFVVYRNISCNCLALPSLLANTLMFIKRLFAVWTIAS